MKEALLRLAGSMKFWTLVLTLLGCLAAKYGFEVDAETYWSIVGLGTALLIGQGLTDQGKAAAQVHTEAEWHTDEDDDEDEEIMQGDAGPGEGK
jgi:hypothetical protein